MGQANFYGEEHDVVTYGIFEPNDYNWVFSGDINVVESKHYKILTCGKHSFYKEKLAWSALKMTLGVKELKHIANSLKFS
jgi:hypothetical protein